jgi:Flp pilus assembly protein TadB
MEKNNEYSGMEEVQKNYEKLSERLERQEMVSDKLIREAMKSKLNSTEQWYNRRLMIPIIILALSVAFIILGLNKWYIALVVFTGVFEFVSDRVCIRKLGLGDLMEQDMKTASERVIAHRKARRTFDILEVIPSVPMLTWTAYIGSGNRWEISMVALIVIIFSLGIFRGIKAARKRAKELDDFVNSLGN